MQIGIITKIYIRVIVLTSTKCMLRNGFKKLNTLLLVQTDKRTTNNFFQWMPNKLVNWQIIIRKQVSLGILLSYYRCQGKDIENFKKYILMCCLRMIHKEYFFLKHYWHLVHHTSMSDGEVLSDNYAALWQLWLLLV